MYLAGIAVVALPFTNPHLPPYIDPFFYSKSVVREPKNMYLAEDVGARSATPTPM